MRLWVMSDLHTEHAPLKLPLEFPDADVCVVAGDFGVRGMARSLKWLYDKVAPAMPVVVVAGNHDFFKASVVEGLAEARAVAEGLPGVHFLENDTVELGGVVFAGCTLWTDFTLFGSHELAMHAARSGMLDYRKIAYSKRPFKRFTPHQAVRMHFESRSFLAKTLGHEERRVVVVSHHAPSPQSLPQRFQRDPLSPAYASDLEDFMELVRPDLWVHGHVHEAVDYTVGQTRVVSSPRGYPGERTGDFEGAVFDVAARGGQGIATYPGFD